MLGRPISFAMIYVTTMLHFALLIVPFCILAYIFINFIADFSFEQVWQYVKQFWWLCLFIISFGVCIYIIMDFLLGFTMKSMSKSTSNVRNFDEYAEIYKIFSIIKDRFNKQNVDLHIIPSDQINAYALGTFKKSRIFVTDGLIFYFMQNCTGEKEFNESIGGILGHEMSHIINMDFLPGTFSYCTEKILAIISRTLDMIALYITSVFTLIPFIGKLIQFLLLKVYKATSTFFIDMLYNGIISPLNNFFRLMLSRYIEYRSDRDSAKALGGECIAMALTKLNDNKGMWRSIFSSHPATKYRIKKATPITVIDGNITPSFVTDFANMWCIVLLFTSTFFLGYKANAQNLHHYIITGAEMTYEKCIVIKDAIVETVETVQKMYNLMQKFSKILGK